MACIETCFPIIIQNRYKIANIRHLICVYVFVCAPSTKEIELFIVKLTVKCLAVLKPALARNVFISGIDCAENNSI